MSRSRFGRLHAAAAALLVILVAVPRPAHAYLKFGVAVNGRQVTVKWNQTPIRYYVAEGGVPGVGPPQLAATLAQAFSTWQAVPTASVSFEFAGYTNARPGEGDGRSTIGFLAEPDLDRVLASTSLLIDDVTGELLEADIFFNSVFSWSVAPSGEAGRFDVETIAVHEIGHLIGLGHSAIGETEVSGSGRRVIAAETVMFPLAFGSGSVTNRRLRADDIAGVSDLYPDGAFEADTGSISGRVTRNGEGLFGAHVVAFNPATGALVGAFSLNAHGEFSIAGLTPGAHVLRIEPLDDADVESFFEPDPPVEFDFRAVFFNQLVVAPRGADSGSVEVAVQPK